MASGVQQRPGFHFHGVGASPGCGSWRSCEFRGAALSRSRQYIWTKNGLLWQGITEARRETLDGNFIGAGQCDSGHDACATSNVTCPAVLPSRLLRISITAYTARHCDPSRTAQQSLDHHSAAAATGSGVCAGHLLDNLRLGDDPFAVLRPTLRRPRFQDGWVKRSTWFGSSLPELT